MIKNKLKKYTHVAFICDNFNDINNLIELSTKEKIRFINVPPFQGYHDDFQYFLEHLDPKHKSLILMDLTEVYDVRYTIKSYKYHFYTRSYKDYNDYSDWYLYKFVNFSRILKLMKLKKINKKCQTL